MVNANHAITGVGFQPDFTWIKRTDAATNHHLHNAVRGATKVMYSNSTGNESTDASKNLLHLIVMDLQLVQMVMLNGSDYVLGIGKQMAQGSSNSDGSITSTVSVNQTAGFSIVKMDRHRCSSNYWTWIKRKVPKTIYN